MFKAYDWGDIDQIRQLHYKTLEPIRAMLSVVNPLGVKVAAAYKGLIASDEARLPLMQIDAEHKERIRRALEAGGLLD
jgi:dihydrodipicolinate synthase/N-acetylneuraminate lyase